MAATAEPSGRVSSKVAHAIKEIRQSAGLSQTDVARELGVSQPTVSGWEREESAPGFDDVAAIERICRHPKGSVFRLAGYAPEVDIAGLLLSDPKLTIPQRRIAADTYRMWVRMARVE